MVNLFEILENAPIGQHLYSPQYGELSFCGIDRSGLRMLNPISGEYHHYTKDGKRMEIVGIEPIAGSCALYPSKYSEGWDDWQEQLMPHCQGSVIVSNGYLYGIGDEHVYSSDPNDSFCIIRMHKFDFKDARFATAQERKRFYTELYDHCWIYNPAKHDFEKMDFQILNEHWYVCTNDCSDYAKRLKCNSAYKVKLMANPQMPKNKRIELYDSNNSWQATYGDWDEDYIAFKKDFRPAMQSEIPSPKFAIGDTIRSTESNKNVILQISGIHNEYYTANFDCGTCTIPFSNESFYELVEKPYTKSDFKPFDKVIVRGFNNVWKCSIFSHHNAGNYITTDSTYTECVPYNDETAYLIGTDIDYDGKYRTY